MNYATIKNYDIANGEGVRVSLFVSGCPHHCKDCFNKETWDYHYGKKFTKKEEDKIIEYLKEDYIEGLTLLGGEPMWPETQKQLLRLLKRVKEEYPKKTIWCYTGYLFDKEIMNDMYVSNDFTREFLSYIDVLVDGRFVSELKNISLAFRGSENQRIIDVAKSIKKKKIVQKKMEGEKMHVG